MLLTQEGPIPYGYTCCKLGYPSSYAWLLIKLFMEFVFQPFRALLLFPSYDIGQKLNVSNNYNRHFFLVALLWLDAIFLF